MPSKRLKHELEVCKGRFRVKNNAQISDTLLQLSSKPVVDMQLLDYRVIPPNLSLAGFTKARPAPFSLKLKQWGVSVQGGVEEESYDMPILDNFEFGNKPKMPLSTLPDSNNPLNLNNAAEIGLNKSVAPSSLSENHILLAREMCQSLPAPIQEHFFSLVCFLLTSQSQKVDQFPLSNTSGENPPLQAAKMTDSLNTQNLKKSVLSEEKNDKEVLHSSEEKGDKEVVQTSLQYLNRYSPQTQLSALFLLSRKFVEFGRCLNASEEVDFLQPTVEVFLALPVEETVKCFKTVLSGAKKKLRTKLSSIILGLLIVTADENCREKRKQWLNIVRRYKLDLLHINALLLDSSMDMIKVYSLVIEMYLEYEDYEAAIKIICNKKSLKCLVKNCTVWQQAYLDYRNILGKTFDCITSQRKKIEFLQRLHKLGANSHPINTKSKFHKDIEHWIKKAMKLLDPISDKDDIKMLMSLT